MTDWPEELPRFFLASDEEGPTQIVITTSLAPFETISTGLICYFYNQFRHSLNCLSAESFRQVVRIDIVANGRNDINPITSIPVFHYLDRSSVGPHSKHMQSCQQIDPFKISRQDHRGEGKGKNGLRHHPALNS
jgi:hypothetical protein